MPAVSGTIYDSSAAPVGGRTVRAYRRDTGVLLNSTVSSSGTAPGDADYASFSALLRGNGADGATSIVDESPTPKTFTRNGTPVISTAQSKFGGSSLKFGSDGCWWGASNAAFNMGTGDFYIRGWVYADVVGRLNIITAQTVNGYSFYINASNHLEFAQASVAVRLTGTATLSVNTWYWVEVSRVSGTLYLFVDGAADGSVANTNNLNNSDTGVGGYTGIGGSTTFRGYIDDLVIVKGIGGHTAAYTAPAIETAIPITLTTGQYIMDLAGYSGEINVIALDDVAGSTENDLILRTTGV